jgi:hypothetical protein
MDTWTGKISSPDQIIADIHLFSDQKQSLGNAELTYISRVEVAEIPLFLVTSPSYQVWTVNPKTEEWFSQHLLQEPAGVGQASWFAGPHGLKQSYTGILVRVDHRKKKLKKDDITELMFYGVVEQPLDAENPTLRVLALPLSSNRTFPSIASHSGPSASADPLDNNRDSIFGSFLSDYRSPNFGTIQRRDVFESAHELRRTATGRGGVGIQAAAAALSEVRVLVGHKKKKAISQPVNGSEIQRPVSRAMPQFGSGMSRRSPSLSLSHSRKESIDKNLGLIKNDSQQLGVEPTLEQQNKDSVARLVMAAMRLYGLQPPKRSLKEKETASDDEYKTVYHNTYKAVVFTYVSFFQL